MKQPAFSPVSSKISFPAVEDDVLAFWKSEGAFGRSLDLTKEKDPFVFFDGPPFATGLPHYGHLLAGTLKDIVPRYWTMRGRYVSRRFGWDCHGLPVENEVEKAHGISKHNIEDEWGIDVFNEICRSIVLRYTSEWRSVVERMGRWVDFDNQYRTMDPPYMESIWWVFSQMWKKDLIYQGFRVQPYCPRCATPLSNFEMNEGYKDVQSPSVTFALPLVGDPAVKLLVWTTTPWTLPSNVACAVGPNITYLKIKDGDSIYIVAKDRIGAYYKDPSLYSVVEEVSGDKLEGLRYVPLFDYFANVSDKFFTITCADFVSTEDGTGVVHIAPAFGEDDFGVGKNLGLPIVCPVDDEGKFTAEVPEYAGKLVFDADADIIKRLKANGKLVHRGTLLHRYPHCYRCDSALIYKAITTWFMKIEPLKKNMLDNNQVIHWVPSHLQNGRFGKGIESAPDWNISRNRYWGTPIPVWLCECGHRECVGSLDDLHRLAGNGDRSAGSKLHQEAIKKVQANVRSKGNTLFKEPRRTVTFADIPKDDLHRHVVDELALACPTCKKKMSRTPEVLDCWFESGSMPYAQNHYPFENKISFDRNFPADFIAEGLDQTRGWFYTLTVLSSALFGKTAFKNVIVNGIILSEDGKKLSKRLKNYAPPEEVLSKFGADALRLFLINSPAVKAEDLRFSESGVLEMSRAVLLPFWNAYTFFVTYANVDGWVGPAEARPSSGHELDRWIVSLLSGLIASVNREMEEYNLYKVVPLLVDFIDNLTNWYIRRSRRRFWKSENDGDKNDAYATLYWVLVEFSKVMAPFLPFLTEAIYRNLAGSRPGAPKSVHCAPYPAGDAALFDAALDEKMRCGRSIVSMARALRSRFNLKTRQPLSELVVVIRNDSLRGLMQDMAPLFKDELNVKAVRFDSDESSVVSLSAKANFKRLGKILGPKMKEAAAIIESFSAADIHCLERGETRDVLGHAVVMGDIEIRRTKREGVEVETLGEITVALNTTITPELCEECLAREFVNRIQTMRKNAGLNVTDRIAIRCAAPAPLASAVDRFRDYVCGETLAVSLAWDLDANEAAEPVEIDEYKAAVRICAVGT
jgi:isoleucyl-tRNA synthetase